MIEPFDRAVELGAFFLGELGFHLGNLVGEPGPIEILQRGGGIREHGQALVRHFGKADEHDDLLMGSARRRRENAGPDRSHDRCMSGEYAEIALDAGNVDLIDLAGEGKLFGRDEIEVEGGHGLSALSPVTRGLDPPAAQSEKFSFRGFPGHLTARRASRLCPAEPYGRYGNDARRRRAGRGCGMSSPADPTPDRCLFRKSHGSAPWWRPNARTRSPAPGRSSRRPARRSPAPR